LVCAALACAALLFAAPSRAFNYGNAVTPPCHEEMTSAALRAVRKSTPELAPIPPRGDETALVRDVAFDLEDDMRDLAAVSLLLGVRDNDLKGRAGAELDQLALVHGDPEGQREHCLRPHGAGEPGGSEIALRECRAFIAERMQQAFDALDASGAPDPNVRMSLAVDLVFRGRVDAWLPTFYVRLGQALHALQDGYSHTFRTPDGSKVTAVLDWLEYVEGGHSDALHGPAHQRDLDRCDDADALRARNRRLAVAASTSLVAVAVDRRLSRAEKTAEVERILGESLTYQAGCTAENAWCDAPENAYADTPSCGCTLAGARKTGASVVALGAALGIALLVRRRRGGSAAAGISLGVLAVLGVLAPRSARADDPQPALPSTDTLGSAAPAAPPPAGTPSQGATPVEVARETKEAEHKTSLFKLSGAVAGSIVEPAFAASVGARLRLSDTWLIGLDGELNWWYGVQTSELKLGSTNIYGSLIARFPMRFAPVNLRSTAQLGTAIELLDLYGVPRGSVGIFAGILPLGIEWKLSKAAYVVFHPLGVAIPVPQLTGAPFAYTQFRTTLGLELAL